jgi:hypothetical protein
MIVYDEIAMCAITARSFVQDVRLSECPSPNISSSRVCYSDKADMIGCPAVALHETSSMVLSLANAILRDIRIRRERSETPRNL